MNKELQKKYEQQARSLVSRMTLEEKVSQTTSWAQAVDRLDIPAYNWWNEALHGVARAGVATVFPQAITLAGSFDEDLAQEVADVISTEGRAKYNMQKKVGDTDIYKGLTFWSPNINIFRDPRWGRGHETFGEDPYLTSRMGVRFIKGIQGEDENYLKAAACAKHFAVHSGPEALRHEFDARVSGEDLFETYLPAFKAAVCEGEVEAVMGAYNRVNGEPSCGSKYLLTDVLRKAWGFTGHVVSDCWAIGDFHKGHGVTEDALHSAVMAAENGCDLNCGECFKLLGEAVAQGLLAEEVLDEMVVRLFTTRMKLGILTEGDEENRPHNPYDDISFLEVDSEKHRAFNREVAARSMVLLKNDQMLPLREDDFTTIGVIGPNADSRKALVGNYEGTSSEYVTVLQGIREALGDMPKKRLLYSEGCHLYKDRVEGLGEPDDRMSEVKEICRLSDLVVCVLGLDASLEGEEGDAGNAYASGDKKDLELVGLQGTILREAIASGKPVVLILMTGSAMNISYAKEHAKAILYAGYPGAQGGRAVADLLFGKRSPEGKLPITFYESDQELPEFTDYAMAGRTYRYMEQKALYPFGYGLSYSPVEIANVQMLPTDEADGIRVCADMTNLGTYETAQTLQVYVSVSAEGAPKWQLKGLKKVRLAPCAQEHVELLLPRDAFALHDQNGEEIYGPDCKVYIGSHQPDAVSCELLSDEPIVFEVATMRGRIRIKNGSLLDEIIASK